MKSLLGVALMVAGLVLLGFGVSAADSPMSELSEAVTGEPTDRALMFLFGGAVVASLGVATIVFKARR